MRVLQLTEQVTSASLLAATQALVLREKQGELDDTQLSKELKTMRDAVLSEFAFVDEDRPLENDLRNFMAKIQQQHWTLY